MHPNPFFFAELETPHFTFRCVAETRDAAEKAIQRAWDKHRKRTGAAVWGEFADSVNVTEIEIGQVFGYH